jgi:hypothetical protein
MPCANVTSASLCAASALTALDEVEAAAEDVVGEACVSVAELEQPLITTAAAVIAATPYPYRLCCIALPSYMSS